jgi:hypothetical protein
MKMAGSIKAFGKKASHSNYLLLLAKENDS